MSISVETQPNPSSFASNDSSSSNDFVLISPSNSFEQECSSGSRKQIPVSSLEASSNKFTSDARKEDEILEKLIAVKEENEKLKETLKNNNAILQKYIKDFTEMQENHRLHKENLKREHQRAKEVVIKLRDDNRTLKQELIASQLQVTQEAKRERVAGLERENAFLKNEITLLQEHITNIDQDLKDCELPEATSEHWRVLIGSLASYTYQTGIPQRNLESVAIEVSSSTDKGHNQLNSNFKEKYHSELETEKEILKVDLEKIRVEKCSVEEKLKDLEDEYNQLNIVLSQTKEEKQKMKELLDEQCQSTVKEQQDHKELKTISKSLQIEVQKLNGELQDIQNKLAKTEEEKEELSKALDTASQKQTEIQKSTNAEGYDDDDDDEHALCKEKYKAIHELYFKTQKQVNAMEERENTLCAKEKAFELETKQLEERKQQLEAELHSHSKIFLEKTEQMHSELQEAREREETLQKQIAQFQQVEQEYCTEREETLQKQVCQLIKENEAMRVKIDKLTELNSRRDTLYEERIKKMEKENKNKEKESSTFIVQLQSRLEVAEENKKSYLDQYRAIKSEHDRVTVQHEQLLQEYDELLNSFNGTLEENKMKNSNTSAEIENYKGQMDEMAVQLASAEEGFTKKEVIIIDLNKRLQMMESQWREDANLLNEQMQVYRNDFNVEREARERQHADLLHLQEENQRLTQTNEELQMELDNIMNHHQMAEMQRRHLAPQQPSSAFNPDAFASGFQLRGRGETDQRERWHAHQAHHAPDPRVQQESEPEEPFPCPGCRRNFPHFDELENHVQRCQDAIHQSRPSQGNQLVCPVCQEECPDQDTLQIHVQECLRDA